ncbi:unnamed protein product [Didymodactylos carnosus]|uniref:Uncharacterized protein n=1 Tax=Didymodactylos carnosus TaxID=1234261 RepID=A0A814KG71_9BILA|nr:unnamed protein product [Didymodactylos carnosus]CAF3821597.1 unnamed protein product [Didymodactylos carnosus]
MCSTTIEATTSVQNNTVLMKKSPITSSARQFNEQQTDPTASLADIIQKAIKDSQAIILNKMNELKLKCVIGSNEQLNMKKQLEQNIVPQMNGLTGRISSLCSKLGQTGIIKVDEEQKSLSQVAQLEHLYQIQQKRVHSQPNEEDRNMHTISNYAL